MERSLKLDSEPRYATGGSGTVELMRGKDASGKDISVVSFDVDTGRMELSDGRVWDSYTTCYNQLINGCTRKQADAYDGYCYSCQHEINKIREEQDRKELFLSKIKEGITIGGLPDDFEAWKPRGLVACQSVALNECNMDYERNIWLHGLAGRGKTEVTYNVIMQALENGVTAAFIEAKYLAETSKQHNRRRYLEGARLLILDDIGKMFLSEYAAADLHALLSIRNKNHARTIVTAEDRVINNQVVKMTASQFSKDLSAATNGHYGNSTVERLSWKGNVCKGIEMIGENLRRAK